MKARLVIAICLIFNACSNGDSYNRGYVISKSHPEPEVQDEVADPSVSLWDLDD